MIICEDIIQKRHIANYSEFFFVMCLAAECYRRGTQLDIHNIKIIEPEILSDSDREYLHFLKSIGAIYDGKTKIKRIEQGTTEFKDLGEPIYYFNVENITKLKDKLFKDEGDRYYWSHDWAKVEYGYEFFRMMNKKDTCKMLMHFLAHQILCFFTGEKLPKPIVIEYSIYDSKTMYMYINILSCTQSMPWFGEIVHLKFNEGGPEDAADKDFYMMYDNARNAGRFAHHTVTKKLEVMKKYGIKVGSVVVVYERNRVSDANVVGKISGALIGIVEDISIKDNYLITVRLLAINKTKEEVELDYYSIEPEYRYNFMDLLKFKVPTRIEKLSLYDLGICDYFYKEGRLMGLLDKSEVVTKTITIEDEPQEVSMSAVDAIYWLLNEYKIDFNHDLYKEMYSNGRPLKWDECGQQPISDR